MSYSKKIIKLSQSSFLIKEQITYDSMKIDCFGYWSSNCQVEITGKYKDHGNPYRGSWNGQRCYQSERCRSWDEVVVHLVLWAAANGIELIRLKAVRQLKNIENKLKGLD